MLIDARELDHGHVIPCDVCIVGAGAAGIAIARTFRLGSTSVCLLESGGLTFDDRTHRLYDGPAEGTALNTSRSYLLSTRLRYFGGTTNHWAGYCRPLDRLDFTERSWVPYSGWPIGRDDLDPYYGLATDVLQIGSFEGTTEGRGWEPGAVVFDGAIPTRQFHLSPTRFGTRFRQELASAANLKVYLNANLVQVGVNDAAAHVDRLDVATLGGKRFTVIPKLVVLAAGGIENARLLLASDRVHRAGLGNARDLVGRFFMEHPGIPVGHILLTAPLRDPDLYHGSAHQAFLSLSDQLQRQHQLLNGAAFLRFQPVEDAPDRVQQLARTLSALERIAGRSSSSPPLYARVGIQAEQSPNPESRVTLIDETDELGMRHARLDWRLSARDIESARRTMEVIALELGRRGLGRGQAVEEVDLEGIDFQCHHMGTTRMSAGPALGVVDAHCRVHGVANLYVAGSSVFPTSGLANPTFTIVALALRLADHLKAVLGGG
jgi:choline dehydrogenase-like flavoprotein